MSQNLNWKRWGLVAIPLICLICLIGVYKIVGQNIQQGHSQPGPTDVESVKKQVSEIDDSLLRGAVLEMLQRVENPAVAKLDPKSQVAIASVFLASQRVQVYLEGYPVMHSPESVKRVTAATDHVYVLVLERMAWVNVSGDAGMKSAFSQLVKQCDRMSRVK